MAALPVFDTTHLKVGFDDFADLVVAHAPLLDRLNRFPVPDADTGRNLSASLRAATGGLEPSGGLAPMCRALAEQAFLGARGNSGTIMAQLIAGFCGAIAGASELDGATLAAALIGAAEAGPEAVVEVAPGSILTVAAEVADAVGVFVHPGDAVGALVRPSRVQPSRVQPSRVQPSDAVAAGPHTARGERHERPGVVEVLERARDAGRAALARTRQDNPVLARAGVVDSGALGFVLLFDALLHVADGRPLPSPEDTALDVGDPAGPGGEHAERPGPDAVDGPGYELMFELEARGVERPEVMALLARWGSSVAVTGRAGRWTCHVHTDDVDAVLRAVAVLGRTSSARVEPLRPVG